jgi:hypothetical protein
LQIAVKAISNLARPDRIVPTFLVFGAYPQMTEMDALSLSITKRAEAIHTAIKEVYYLQTERQVKNILTIRNSLNTISILSLLILLKVHIWCKKDS